MVDGGTSYELSSAGVNVNLATGHGYRGDAEGDLLFDNDGLIGNAGNNSIWGGQGIDTNSGREQSQQGNSLIDHPVGACGEAGRHFEPEHWPDLARRRILSSART